MPLIIYDGACPFCGDYVRRLRLAARHGPVTLLSAREPDPRIDAYWRAGHDLDQGMILVFEGQVFHGGDALAMLGRMSAPDDLFNRVNRGLLARPGIARLLDPLFKAARRWALAAKGEGPLGPPRPL